MENEILSPTLETSSAGAGIGEQVQGAGRMWTRAAGVVAFAALTVASARLAVPLPGTAVPFTWQVVAVLLAGFVLGPRLGALSQGLYVAAGVAGLPVFAAGGGAAYLLGPTGGYLVAYPAAAAVAGVLAGRGAGGTWKVVGGLAGVAVIHLGGVAWLAVGLGIQDAFRTGVTPFVAGDLLKIALAVAVAWRLEGRSRRLFG